MKKALLHKQITPSGVTNLDALPFPSWVFDLESGRISWQNAVAFNFLKIGNAEGQLIQSYFCQLDLAALLTRLESCPFSTETGVFTQNSKVRNGQVQFTRLNESDVLMSFYESEEAVKVNSSSRELPDLSIGYFRDLFENASDLIQGIDRNGDLLYANKSWFETLGYSFDEKNKLSVFTLIIPEQNAAYQKHLEGVVKGESDGAMLWTLITKKGKRILVESNENLRRENGKPHSIRSIMRNVSDTWDAEARADKTKARIEAFFNSSNIVFWTVNQAKALTSFNKKYDDTVFKLYGVHPEINEDLNVPKKKFATETYHEFWDGKYQEVFETGKSIFFQTLTKDIEGNQYNREIYLNPIRESKNPKVIAEVAGIALDVTAKYKAEQQLVAQAAQIKNIFEASQLLTWSIDAEWTLTSFNEWFEKCVEIRFGHKAEIGSSFIELAELCGLNTGAWNSSIQQVLQGHKVSFEYEMVDAHGKHHAEEVLMSPIVNSQGGTDEVAIIAQTVTARKSAEKTLREQASKINAIFDSTALYMYTLDREYRLVSYNKMFAQQHISLFGVEVCIGSNFIDTTRNAAGAELVEQLKQKIDSVFLGKTEQFDSKVCTPQGRVRWMENFYNPIHGDNEEITEISCLSFDISDKKEIERNMVESIKEKEVLLQEVHHRVKNNLQVINSMLNLQSSYVKEANSLAILQESQNRIKSMSFIHESLYMTNDFTQIDFGEYLLGLTKNLIHSYGLNRNQIEVDADIEELYLSIDQAIPCGLIVNEVVSNALKYAFTNRDGGKITLRLKLTGQNVSLVIGDDGPGLPEGFDYRQAESLGLQLIFTLIEQLDGSISLDNEGGTKFLINFDKQ